MAFELNDMSMMLFTNKFQRHGGQPAWQGQMKINGENYRVACWDNEGRNGPYKSCKIETEEAYNARREQSQANNNQSQPQPEDFDDDVPF